MILKPLIQQIDSAAAHWLPLSLPATPEITDWAALHGWNPAEPECQRLLVRQALLNSALRQVWSPVENSRILPTPLDGLGIEASASLRDAITKAAQAPVETTFNFWGELHNALIPQARRRLIGQFWTQETVADWMVAWLLQASPQRLADIGCGAGNFLLKAAQRQQESAMKTRLYGCDISPLLVNVALTAFGTQYREKEAAPTLEVRNYFDMTLPTDIDAVICNPPYTRHHDIPPSLKDSLHAYFKARLQLDAPRQATLAFYFLLKLIAEVPNGARAAVILPMEVLDARYGRAARRVLCQYTSLAALIHFSPQMNAFRKVDVGASILLFQKGCREHHRVRHLTLTALPTTEELLECLEADGAENTELPFGSVVVQPQEELPTLSKWFSIATAQNTENAEHYSDYVVPLKSLAKVMRGIATGANRFFVLTTEQISQHALKPFVVRTLQRNREVQSLLLDERHWQTLSDEGKGVWLLYLNGQDIGAYPALYEYIKIGEAQGLHLRSLVQTRKRWYAMEQREIPALFFTILTRGNPRFILNRAGVRPLNMFSLLYPNRLIVEADLTEVLWALLNSSFSLSRLHSVSRTYGGNTLKVEPRELDNLPVIHPLKLPEDIRRKLRSVVAAYYIHKQAAVLTREVDALIEPLLTVRTKDPQRASQSVQLRLPEIADENYTIVAYAT